MTFPVFMFVFCQSPPCLIQRLQPIVLLCYAIIAVKLYTLFDGHEDAAVDNVIKLALVRYVDDNNHPY